MPVHVSDVRSNPNDQIAHAAKVIGRSNDRAKVFDAICTGKQRVKTVQEIHRVTKLSRKRVLEEGRKLSINHIVAQTKIDGDTAYEKDTFYCSNKSRILSLAKSPKKLAVFPTKVTPQALTGQTVVIKLPKQRIRCHLISVDDVDSFSKVKRHDGKETPIPMYENEFKTGIKRILNEHGKFTDWGGEKNDLFTTRLRIKGKRRGAAFAFKGRGKRGKLTPSMMGKNGDQIQRLFMSPAEVFIVQYWNQIDESVIQQMAEFAKAKSVSEGKEILYGVIDGQDSIRLIQAYPRAFGATTTACKRN